MSASRGGAKKRAPRLQTARARTGAVDEKHAPDVRGHDAGYDDTKRAPMVDDANANDDGDDDGQANDSSATSSEDDSTDESEQEDGDAANGEGGDDDAVDGADEGEGSDSGVDAWAERSALDDDDAAGADDEDEPVVRLPAAIMKTKMSPSMLQNPNARRRIWQNLMRMLEHNKYKWVQHAPEPTDTEQLLPNGKGVLGTFHMHAEDTLSPAREPVYVVFCYKAGDPTMKSIVYPSRHVIIVADALISRARTGLDERPIKAPPLYVPHTNGQIPTSAAREAAAGEALQHSAMPHSSGASAVLANAASVPPPPSTSGLVVTAPAAAASSSAGEEFVVVDRMEGRFIQAFTSSQFMHDLMAHRYLHTVRFLPLAEGGPEIKRAMHLFERGGDRSHFPRMFESDPVARYLGLRPSNLVQITRMSTSAGQHVAYRTVVPPPVAPTSGSGTKSK